jgi:hypothetical protein
MRTYFPASLFIVFIMIKAGLLLEQDKVDCIHLSDWDASVFTEIQQNRTTSGLRNVEMPVVIHKFSNWNDQQIMGLVNQLNIYFSNNSLDLSFTLCDFIDYDTAMDLSTSETQVLAERPYEIFSKSINPFLYVLLMGIDC